MKRAAERKKEQQKKAQEKRKRAEQKRQAAKRKKDQEQKEKRNKLIEKYGDEFGSAIFSRKVLNDMTTEMVIESIGKPKYKDSEKWYYGKPFNRLITFKDKRVLSDEKLDKSIWLDMPKDMLVASWGKPADEKEDISKDKVKLKWYFGARQTRQSTTVYKHEVRLENDLVVGWRELE